MNIKDIIKEINNILNTKSIKVKINEETINKTFKELGADSLTLLELVMDLEEKFKITLPDEELMNIKSANDLVQLISKSLK